MSDAAARPEADFLSRFDAARLADVERFRLMLTAANARMNLVGASTLDDFHRRHFLDSAQLLALMPRARVWADLGSGAGLPGLILAIALKGEEGACVHLVESVTKKCRFICEVVSELGLPAQVHNARAEALSISVQVVTARACAPLTRLLGFAKPYLDRSAKGLFLKGAEVDTEIGEARESWRFAAKIHSSLSDEHGRIVEVSELKRGR